MAFEYQDDLESPFSPDKTMDFKSDFLLPVTGNLDDIAISPLVHSEHEGTTEIKQVATRKQRAKRTPKKDKWTSEEDQIIIDFYIEHGGKWKQISSQLRGKAPHLIKNRFYGTLKKQLTREQQRRITSNKLNNYDFSGGNFIGDLVSQECDMSSQSNCTIGNFSINEKNTKIRQEQRTKMQKLYGKMAAIQAFITKTHVEISNLRQLNDD